MVPAAQVAGGEVSEPNKYPWLASIICDECQANETHKNPWGHICGGSLITQRHIITAAHCVTYADGTSIEGWTRTWGFPWKTSYDKKMTPEESVHFF